MASIATSRAEWSNAWFTDAVAAVISSWCGRRDLKQSLPTEIRWKREFRLVLHRKFQNVSQTFGLVSIIEANAGAVKCGSGHPILASQKPMASGYR
jgi:hypothetical protein